MIKVFKFLTFGLILWYTYRLFYEPPQVRYVGGLIVSIILAFYFWVWLDN